MTFRDIRQLVTLSGISLHEGVLISDMAENGQDPDESRKILSAYLSVILEESAMQYGNEHQTLTGLTGKNAASLAVYEPRFLSPFAHTAMVVALSIAESNASMGRVVACPTAGASGVIPGIFYALHKIHEMPFDQLLQGFIVCSGVGNVIASQATLSGAAGGCQAEIGSACAMAAAGLTYVSGGNIDQVEHAGALSLKATMGLVCDPVGGYVEVPCVKRNAIGANIAISSAEMALSGIESFIPFDETVWAMKKVGLSMGEHLRETGLGGVAITPTAKRWIKESKHADN